MLDDLGLGAVGIGLQFDEGGGTAPLLVGLATTAAAMTAGWR